VSLSERLTAAKPAQRGLPCRMALILDDLAPDDAQALQVALDTPIGNPERLSAMTLAAMLTLEGYEIHYKSVETHRKGACRCGTSRETDT
jgi:hypothetical protein